MNKVVKRILVFSGCVLGGVILAAGGYVGYVLLSYNRIGNQELTVDERAGAGQVQVGQTYKAMTYNIGFGAYSQDYTFFLDKGYDNEGNQTCGHWSKARSKEAVEFNTQGAVDTALAYDADFYFFQEVDTNSTRSHFINQDNWLSDSLPSYDHVHACNFHTTFLPYPLYDMHGAVNGGLSTFSRYHMHDSWRKEYTVSSDFSKYFDLDRCFSYAKVDVNNGKSLYLVNSHMSAYDEGGTIREQQVAELNAFLSACAEEGSYVIIGGDWNHDLLLNNPDYGYNQNNRPFGMTKKAPDWLSYFFDEGGNCPIDSRFAIAASDNGPTCRNNDIEWDPNETYQMCVDGFIVSNYPGAKVQIVTTENLVTGPGNKGVDGFAYSDHEPATISFRLL